MFKKLLSGRFVEWLMAFFIAVVAFIATLWIIVLVYLPYYTRHGKEVEVPYVIGMKSDEAIRMMNESKLRYVLLGKGNYVVKTVPGPGTVVKIGRKVKLTLGSQSTLR